MTAYLTSFAAGLLVGVIYGLLGVRSPAPPAIALVGLFGILLGEQVVPLTRHLAGGGMGNLAWLRSRGPHIFGRLPMSSLPPTAAVVPESDHHA